MPHWIRTPEVASRHADEMHDSNRERFAGVYSISIFTYNDTTALLILMLTGFGQPAIICIIFIVTFGG